MSQGFLLLNQEEMVDFGSSFGVGSSLPCFSQLRLPEAGLSAGGSGVSARLRLCLTGGHGEPLAVEHSGLAAALDRNECGTDFCRGGGILQRTGGKPKLHAASGLALAHLDDRDERLQRGIRGHDAAP